MLVPGCLQRSGLTDIYSCRMGFLGPAKDAKFRREAAKGYINGYSRGKEQFFGCGTSKLTSVAVALECLWCSLNGGVL